MKRGDPAIRVGCVHFELPAIRAWTNGNRYADSLAQSSKAQVGHRQLGNRGWGDTRIMSWYCPNAHEGVGRRPRYGIPWDESRLGYSATSCLDPEATNSRQLRARARSSMHASLPGWTGSRTTLQVEALSSTMLVPVAHSIDASAMMLPPLDVSPGPFRRRLALGLWRPGDSMCHRRPT